MFSFSFHSKKSQSKSQPFPSSMNPRRPRRKLDRRNAAKNIDYDATTSASFAAADSSSPSSPDTIRITRSLDLSPSYSNQTSFRIGGSIEGEVDQLYRSLGLSGPEDFAITAADWEATRAQRSSSDLLSRSRLYPTNRDRDREATPPRVSENREIKQQDEIVKKNGSGDGGIKGVRPPTLTAPETMMAIGATTQSAPPTMSRSEMNPSPSSVLAPPPSISLPEMEKVGSTWDLVRSFAPDEEAMEGLRRAFESDEEEEEEEEDRRGFREENWDVASTSNDDDSSSTTTEPPFAISPNAGSKRIIKDWMKGHLLGSGSFGTVYEGINK